MGLQKTVGRASVVMAFSLAAILPLWGASRNGAAGHHERGRKAGGEGAHKGRPYGEKRPAGALC